MGELMIRANGAYDINGTFTFASYQPLRPHSLPIGTTRNLVADYSAATGHAATVYDSLLGWAPQANARSQNGLYAYDSSSIRIDPSTPRDYSVSPREGVLRIAIFGDSYTHSDEVPFSDSWGHYLEEQLNAANVSSEVLNFGVGGYGMGQAFLRYKEVGHRFPPQIVIFGFQAENAMRNVNILMPFNNRVTKLPFSKPRFVLDNNDLRLLNSPAVPPQDVAEIIGDMQGWELQAHEYWYDPADYRERVWLKSRALAFGWAVLLENKWNSPRKEIEFYSLQNEPALLSLRIIQEFRKEAESNGAMFLTVHLPIEEYLQPLVNNSELELPYEELLERIGETTDLIDVQQDLMREAKASSLESLYDGHYTRLGYKIVGDAIVKVILDRYAAADPIVN